MDSKYLPNVSLGRHPRMYVPVDMDYSSTVLVLGTDTPLDVHHLIATLDSWQLAVRPYHIQSSRNRPRSRLRSSH